MPLAPLTFVQMVSDLWFRPSGCRSPLRASLTPNYLVIIRDAPLQRQFIIYLGWKNAILDSI
jgi:hypothetical protein